MELPLRPGGFPRVTGVEGSEIEAGGGGMTVPSAGGGQGAGSLGLGGNYAGASFHNSPHGRALPKPDMEDF